MGGVEDGGEDDAGFVAEQEQSAAGAGCVDGRSYGCGWEAGDLPGADGVAADQADAVAGFAVAVVVVA